VRNERGITESEHEDQASKLASVRRRCWRLLHNKSDDDEVAVVYISLVSAPNQVHKLCRPGAAPLPPTHLS
jgi:hypothetical protein